MYAAVPVFLYGEAASPPRTLASLRRSLSFFSPASSTAAVVAPTAASPVDGSSAADVERVPLPLAPDHGPAVMSRRLGATAVGATPWIDNFNVPLHYCMAVAAAELRPGASPAATPDAASATRDAPTPDAITDTTTDAAALAHARRVAWLVSARGGGLPALQALALPHGRSSCACDCHRGRHRGDRGGEAEEGEGLRGWGEEEGGCLEIEIACNLLDSQRTTPQQVEEAVRRMVAREWVRGGMRSGVECGRSRPLAPDNGAMPSGGLGAGMGVGLRVRVGRGYSPGVTQEEALRLYKASQGLE